MKFKLSNFERAIFSTVLDNSINKFAGEDVPDSQPVIVMQSLKKEIIDLVVRYATNEEQLIAMNKEIENGKVVFSNRLLLSMFRKELDIS